MITLTLEQVPTWLREHAQTVVEAEYKNGFTTSGVRVMADIAGTPGERFGVQYSNEQWGPYDPETGQFRDKGSPRGTGLLELLCIKRNKRPLEVARWLAHEYNFWLDEQSAQPTANGHGAHVGNGAAAPGIKAAATDDLNGSEEDTAESAVEIPAVHAEGGNTTAPRTIIRMHEGQLHVYAPEAEKLIANDTFVRAQRLVRIGYAPDLLQSQTQGVHRDKEQRVIVPVNIEYLRRRLTSLAEFQKFNATKGRWFAKDCPKDLATNIQQAGDWQHFKSLDSIATAPFLRSDLSLCETPGYDAASRTYYAPNAKFEPLPQKITKDEAKAALERLLKPFEEFPFNAPESKAAFASHLLASVGRHAIDTRPIMAYTAPLAANGKSLLASMASRIVDGVKPPNKPFTDDGEEVRKVLMSVLIAGDSTVIFDNVPNGSKVRLPVLCAFVTSAVYSDRVLSKSESLTLPNRAAVILTGNNITPCGDLARRCITVRLDTNEETARGRTFAIPNLEEYVRQHRAELLRDGLMVIVGYQQAGWPNPGHPLESFESWSRVARDPLLWLGLPDPVKTQETEAEDDLGPLRHAFAELAKWPDAINSFTSQKLAQHCAEYAGTGLREALQDAGCGDANSATKVGYWLREMKDKVAGPWKLVKSGETSGSTRWKLRAAK